MNGLNLSNIQNAMLGSTQVSALYYGSVKIWENGSNEAWYFGPITEEDAQDQDYINSLTSTLNQTGKPTSFNASKGYNILITPASWGTPRVVDQNGYGISPVDMDELGVDHPEGYILSIIESDVVYTYNIASWV